MGEEIKLAEQLEIEERQRREATDFNKVYEQSIRTYFDSVEDYFPEVQESKDAFPILSSTLETKYFNAILGMGLKAGRGELHDVDRRVGVELEKAGLVEILSKKVVNKGRRVSDHEHRRHERDEISLGCACRPTDKGGFYVRSSIGVIATYVLTENGLDLYQQITQINQQVTQLISEAIPKELREEEEPQSKGIEPDGHF